MQRVIRHIKQNERFNHIITSIVTENASDKIQYLFLIKKKPQQNVYMELALTQEAYM